MEKKYSILSTLEKCAFLAKWLEEHKAKDTIILDLAGKNAFTDAMIVTSASSVRHAQSLSDGIGTACTEQKYEFLNVEGAKVGDWILIDLNDIIINIFLESVREMYNIESLWALKRGLAEENKLEI